MFDYSALHWTSFLTAALLLNVAPGPDIAFILGKTIAGGRRTGLAAMLGIWTGALGLSALLVSSAIAFSAVKWVGAAYLIWLGLQALRSSGGTLVPPRGLFATPPGRTFGQGVLVVLLNPKVAIFFLAFLPQLVEPGTGAVPAQLLLHGLLIIAVAGLVEPPLLFAADRLARGLRAAPRPGLWLDRALGLKLALSHQ